MTDRAAHLEHPSGVQILTLGSYLYLLNVFGWTFNYLFHAGLVGQVILGIIYGTPVGQLLPQDWESTLWHIGYLGLILIVFEGGLFTQLDVLRQNLLLSTVAAATGVLAPIGLSILILSVGFGYSVLDGFAGGAALAATSLGTTFSLLASDFQSYNHPEIKDLRRSRIGSVLLSAALIDDIIGLVLASVIPSIRSSGNGSLATSIARPIAASLGLFLIIGIHPILGLFATVIVKMVRLVRRRKSIETQGHLFIIITILSGLVAGSYYAGASPLLGAWVAGALLGSVDQRLAMEINRSEMQIPSQQEGAAPDISVQVFKTAFDTYLLQTQTYLLAPLFFGSIGTAIPFLGLWTGRIVWQGLVYSVLMTMGKMVVGLWVFVWPNEGGRRSSVYPALLLSFAMVARGEVSLLITQLGGLSEEAYKVVMWAILVCTLLGPVATGQLLRRKRKECSAGVWG